MILQTYLARRFLLTMLGIFAALFLLSVLVEMLETLRKFDVARIGFPEIVKLTALNAPNTLYEMAPLVVILSTIALYLGLSRSSELVVIRSAGRSAMRSIVPPVVVAAVLACILVGVLNPMVAATLKRYDALTNTYLKGTTSTLSVGGEGLWLRQGNTAQQTVIHASRSNIDGTELFDVAFMSFDADGQTLSRIEAQSARLVQYNWELSNAKIWDLTGGKNPERNAVLQDAVSIPTDLTKEGIQDGFGRPATIPIWDLPDFIKRLEDAGFSARRHKSWFHAELAKPAFFAAMVLIGAAFTMRHSRLQKTAPMVLAAIIVGFVVYFIRNFAIVLSENGQLSPLLAAWLPPAAATLLAVGVILHLEDG